MLRSPLNSLLSACLVGSMSQAAASAALTPPPSLPAPVETTLSQPVDAGQAGARLAASHFLSPAASTPVRPHVLTLHDREVLRQQIQGSAQGLHASSSTSPSHSRP
ncbi:transglutaminase [Thiomonas intermedia]|uniref:transglutaminase n=1 Tax=Thiomonas intermedia TaxID=926 RepID=UPI001FE45B6E|nr:transglutaminase [Thiomonas intermedia]